MVPRKNASGFGKAPRKPPTERITVRINRSHLTLMDGLIASGEFPTRSDVIKKAVHELLLSYADRMEEQQKKMEKLQKAAAAAQAMAEMQQK